MCCPSMLIFLFKFNSIKMRSQKSSLRFFCDASVPVPNGYSIGVTDCLDILVLEFAKHETAFKLTLNKEYFNL